MSSGALDGLEVVELRAKGPAPFATTLLADFGASVVRVDRQPAEPASPGDPFGRGRRDVVLDLKSAAGRDAMLGLVERADVLIEAYRPGVAERLGIGPDECMARNPRLVYARMTGWGQDGPLAQQAGHDLNFLALTGALFALGSADRPPPPPLNLVGDFGGGALYLVVGILLALHERARSGRGQVVDAAMVDGVCHLMAPYHHLRAGGEWTLDREANLVDGGAPFYRTYRCADDRFVAVGCLQPAMYEEFLRAHGARPRRLAPGRSIAVAVAAPAARGPVRGRAADVLGDALRGDGRLRERGARPRRGSRRTPPGRPANRS